MGGSGKGKEYDRNEFVQIKKKKKIVFCLNNLSTKDLPQN